MLATEGSYREPETSKKHRSAFNEFKELHLKEGLSMNRCTKEMKKGRETLTEWKRQLQADPTIMRPDNAPKRGRPSTLDEADSVGIRAFIEQNHGQVVIRHVQEYLFQERGKKLSQSAIRMHLKKAMRYSKKKASQYNAKALSDQVYQDHRRMVVSSVSNAILKDFELIYIDESSISRQLLPGKVWTPVGIHAAIPSKGVTLTVSLLAAMTARGVVGIQLASGPTNKVSFLAFLIKILNELRTTAKPGTKFVAYLDNAAYHKAPEVRKAFKRANLSYIFAPPYACFLNPIELLFRHLKGYLGRATTLANK